MSTREEQKLEIEHMRARLHELVMAKAGNMTDLEVATLSTKLDQLIVKYQKAKDKMIT